MTLASANYGKMLNVKKGQLKIQQMAFMLLAVILFFILVALFWLVIQAGNLKKQATQLKENQAIMLSEFLSQATEFSCDDYCIDADRLLILKNKTVYEEFWPVSYIKIRKIGKEKEDIECNKVNYPDCNLFNVYENEKIISKSSTGSFVALCRHDIVYGYTTKVCELGRLIIGYDVE